MSRWMVPLGVVAVAAALVAGCVNGPRVRGPSLAETEIPPPPAGEARIYFYGKNVGLKGFPSVGIWRPTVTIDGEPVTVARNADEIVFYVDRPPGRYDIAVENDVGPRDAPPPSAYDGQRLELEVAADRTYYVKLIAHGSDAFLLGEPSQHYLELKLVPDVLGWVETQRFEFVPVTTRGA